MVSSNNKLIDFEDGMFEMAIRSGQGAYPGLRTELLLRDEVFPVCSPKLLAGPHPLRAPEDLRHHTLLPDAVSRQDESPDWGIWLQRSDEHTSELPSLKRSTYDVF